MRGKSERVVEVGKGEDPKVLLDIWRPTQNRLLFMSKPLLVKQNTAIIQEESTQDKPHSQIF